MTQREEPELLEPDLPRTAKVRKQALRTGWTTGTCAAAAAKAAMTALGTGEIQQSVEIGLPSGQRVRFEVDACALSPGEPRQAEAVVVKDAGDDPDVTHGARLTATVRWRGQPGAAGPGAAEPGAGEPGATEAGLELDGGVGVGVVTKPGLGLELGGPAINPVPRAMITQSVGEAVDLSSTRRPRGHLGSRRRADGPQDHQRQARHHRRDLDPRHHRHRPAVLHRVLAGQRGAGDLGAGRPG